MPQSTLSKYRELKRAVRDFLRLEGPRLDYMRKEYPAGSCGAEDAWRDFGDECRKARLALVELSKLNS